MKLKEVLGAFILGISISLGWYWFGYKLLIVIFLALFGNNLERSERFRKK
jgi:hypothetical protein